MQDYYKEMGKTLNSGKKFNEEMNELLNPMKSLIDSISMPTMDLEFNPLPLQNIPLSLSTLDLGFTSVSIPTIDKSLPTFNSLIAEWQKQLEYDLNPLKKLQEEMEYTLNPLKQLQDEMNLFTNPLKDLKSNLIPIKSALESLSLLQNQTSLFKLNEEIQKALQGIDISALNIDKSIESELEEQIGSLNKGDRVALEEVFETLKNMLPEIEFVSQAYQKKQYVRLLVYFFFFISFVQNYYQEYTQNVISNSYYKINRNNVRVRAEPSTENSSKIIMKLNKNAFVEKIDSHKNWLKIEFEDERGEEIEGWVRRDMLIKIEND